MWQSGLLLVGEHNNASALSTVAESKPIRPRAIRSSNLLICAITIIVSQVIILAE